MKSFIINRMYAGEYLTRGIGGGEVINLLHSDDGINYCFINPSGMIDGTYNDTVEAIIHTRLFEAGCFEVLGVSLIGPSGQLIHSKGATAKERALLSVNQLKYYVSRNPINYGGVPYIKETDTWPSISFRATKLLYPKRQIYLLDSKYGKTISKELTSYPLPDKPFAKQALRMYVDDVKHPQAFKLIFEMINNEDLWEERIVKVNDEEKHSSKRFNFLTLIKKEDDELAFSNMFHHFFVKYPDLFIRFAKEYLEVDLHPEYKIVREFHQIDLWVEDQNQVLVIENKIKSGINGVSERHDFSEGGLVQSQLSKYYAFAKQYGNNHDKEPKFFLFVPNYNKLDLKSYSGSRHYKIINYQSIYKFLEKNKINAPYYDDFCNAIYKHTKDIPVDYSEIVLNYLIKQIKKQEKKK